MTKQQIQERIFDLRNKQANVSPAEREQIQKIITMLYKQLDSMK